MVSLTTCLSDQQCQTVKATAFSVSEEAALTPCGDVTVKTTVGITLMRRAVVRPALCC